MTQDRSHGNIERNNQSGSEITLIKGNSQVEITRNEVIRRFPNLKVDLMFIDGDHEYPGVMRDLNIWTSLVRRGGILVLDD